MRIWRAAAQLLFCATVFSYRAGSQPASGSVEGQVVDEATGAPLKNATVKLRYLRQGSSYDPLVQQTNDEGRFRFADLWGVGEYELSAERRGFIPGYYGAGKYASRGVHLTLPRNQQVKDLTVKLAAESVLSGHVLDADGEPVEGAKVAVLKSIFAGGIASWREITSATTLDNGEYRCPRLPAGHYLVKCAVPRMERAPAASSAETGYVVTYYPNVTDELQAAPITTTAGAETSGIDIHVVTSRLFSVRARFGSAGPPQAGGQTVLFEKTDETKAFATAELRWDERLYTLSRIPPGSYILHAMWYDAGRYIIGNQPIEVRDRDVDVILNSAPAAAIQGSIKLDPGGREVDLRKMSIGIEPEMMTASCGNSQHLTPKIGEDLKFTFDARWAAPCFVRFTAQVSDIPDGCYLVSIRYGGLDVPPSGTEYMADAALEVTIGADGGWVDGSVRDKQNQPAVSAVVALYPASGKGMVRSIQAGADGRFHFAGVVPGDYKLLAWDDIPPDDLENPGLLKQFDGLATALTVSAADHAAATVQLVR